VYQRFDELAKMPGGPEWTVEWAWSPDGQSIKPTLVVGDRIGAVAPPGLIPAARFSYPGNLIDAQRPSDYSEGKGANDVLAYSSGQGSSGVPNSGHQLAADFQGRPTFELRYQPVVSTTDDVLLAQYAQRVVQAISPNGAMALVLVADLNNPSTPVYGRDWKMGDDVLYTIGGRNSQGIETARAFPGGIVAVARPIAYQFDLTTITPIVAQPDPLAAA
jgi:hypothetical protein